MTSIVITRQSFAQNQAAFKRCLSFDYKNQQQYRLWLQKGQMKHITRFISTVHTNISASKQFACRQELDFHIYRITSLMIITIILSGMGKLKIWAPMEDEILTKVSNSIKSKKWKKASEQLRKCGFERTDVECRERYINHLDPSVNKQLWSEEELEILYSKYGEYGNKWFLLQKHLPGRTQTKIKNYFYGTIRYFLKIIVKYFCKRSTGFINDIKTEVLLDMYEAKGSFQGCSIIHKTIKKLKFKVQRCACQKIIRQNEEIFKDFTQNFLTSETEKSSHQQDAQEQEQIVEEPSSQKSMVKIECVPVQPTKIEVISSTGEGDKSNLQLDHLRTMAMKHFQWYEHYQNAYQNLLIQKQQNYQ